MDYILMFFYEEIDLDKIHSNTKRILINTFQLFLKK